MMEGNIYLKTIFLLLRLAIVKALGGGLLLLLKR